MNKRCYVSKINAQIPKAMELAKKDLEAHLEKGGRAIEQRPATKGKQIASAAGHQVAAGNSEDQYRSHCMLTEFFHVRINELAREAGLRSC